MIPNAMQLLRLSRTTSPRQPGEKKLGSKLGAEPTKFKRAQTDFSRNEKRRETGEAGGHTDWCPVSESSIPTGDLVPYHTLLMSREKFFWKYKQSERVRYKQRTSNSGMRVGLAF